MTSYVALLRGINVGGKNKVSMKDLVKLFEKLGFADVSTYVNSGNVMFKAEVGNHAPAIEAAITKELDLTIRVMVKAKEELVAAVAANPFTHETIESDRTLFCSFCFDPITPELKKEIAALSRPEELLEPREWELYTLLVRGDFPTSFMGKSLLLKKYKVDSTTRNWNTLNTLIAKM